MTCAECGDELHPMGSVITKEGLCAGCDFKLNSKPSRLDWERVIEEAFALERSMYWFGIPR